MGPNNAKSCDNYVHFVKIFYWSSACTWFKSVQKKLFCVLTPKCHSQTGNLFLFIRDISIMSVCLCKICLFFFWPVPACQVKTTRVLVWLLQCICEMIISRREKNKMISRVLTWMRHQQDNQRIKTTWLLKCSNAAVLNGPTFAEITCYERSLLWHTLPAAAGDALTLVFNKLPKEITTHLLALSARPKISTMNKGPECIRFSSDAEETNLSARLHRIKFGGKFEHISCKCWINQAYTWVLCLHSPLMIIMLAGQLIKE